MTQDKQESAFKAFGFVSEEARRNFVVFIIVVLLLSNAFFIRQNIVLTNRIQHMNKEHNEMIINLSQQITDEVRKQIQPTQARIQSTTDKIDNIANKIQEEFDSNIK